MRNKTCPSLEFISKYSDFGVRIVVGLIFLIAGLSKLMNGAHMFTGMLNNIGFPMPVVFAWLVTIIEIVGGLFLILGLFDKIVASLLAIIMIVALFTVHLGSWNESRYPLLLLVLLVKFIGSKGNCGIMGICKKKH